MANPPRAKGTAAETAVVRWARAHGFPHADRQPLRGGRDQGDLTLTPGVIVEVKAHRLPTGVPTRGQLDDWMAQTGLEQFNADAALGVLVVKRPGTTDPGRWFAYVTTVAFLDVVGADCDVPAAAERQPVCLSLESLAVLLRASGWGAPLEGEDDAA